MNKSATPQHSGTLEQLKNRIHEIEPLLDVKGEFTSMDISEMGASKECIRFLSETEVLEQVGKRRPAGDETDHRHLIIVWEWNEYYRKELVEYAEQLDRLPCGHRVHIHNPRETPEDIYSCKHCMDDGKVPEFSKQQLLELQP